MYAFISPPAQLLISYLTPPGKRLCDQPWWCTTGYVFPEWLTGCLTSRRLSTVRQRRGQKIYPQSTWSYQVIYFPARPKKSSSPKRTITQEWEQIKQSLFICLLKHTFFNNKSTHLSSSEHICVDHFQGEIFRTRAQVFVTQKHERDVHKMPLHLCQIILGRNVTFRIM